jgi:bifunctional DNase/RNase
MILKKLKVGVALVGLWLIVSTCSCGEIPAKESASAALGEEELVRVNIQKLIVDPVTQNPVVTLSDPDKKRALFIWIGPSEARAIYAELHGIKHFRPLTHDLLASVISEVNGEVHRIVITHAKKNVFYATIMIEKDGSQVEIDARPSDSLVMALKFEAPVFVTKTLFERMSLPLEEKAGIEDEYGLALQELTPELSAYLSFSSKRGVMVSGIRKGSQAAKDGLKTGDIIVDIGGQLIGDVSAMKKVFAETKAPVKVGIFRNSRFMTFTLHLPR